MEFDPSLQYGRQGPSAWKIFHCFPKCISRMCSMDSKGDSTASGRGSTHSATSLAQNVIFKYLICTYLCNRIKLSVQCPREGETWVLVSTRLCFVGKPASSSLSSIVTGEPALWCNRINQCLVHWHLLCAPIWVHSASLIIQLPSNAPVKVVEDGPGAWAPATHMDYLGPNT